MNSSGLRKPCGPLAHWCSAAKVVAAVRTRQNFAQTTATQNTKDAVQCFDACCRRRSTALRGWAGPGWILDAGAWAARKYAWRIAAHAVLIALITSAIAVPRRPNRWAHPDPALIRAMSPARPRVGQLYSHWKTGRTGQVVELSSWPDATDVKLRFADTASASTPGQEYCEEWRRISAFVLETGPPGLALPCSLSLRLHGRGNLAQDAQ